VLLEEHRIARVPFSKWDQLLIRLRCLDRCLNCRKRISTLHWHMEHTKRHACGGSNSHTNIASVCVACHELKNQLTLGGSNDRFDV
jgi:5-methylcytosine-specific restriction endonuclease McrA